MTGLSHTLMSWFIGQASGDRLRDRNIIAWMGVAPDFDVIAGILGLFFNGGVDGGYQWHWAVHHRYTHGITFMLLAATIGYIFGHKKIQTALFSLFTSGLHIICDVIGSGSDWPVYPLWPVDDYAWTVEWSMELFDWPNLLIQSGLIVAAFYYAIKTRRTPFEMVGKKIASTISKLIKNHESNNPTKIDL